ncbi:DUF3040 domain-containing protein, partial [Kitasatospora sp. NPDC048722]|uniref:DUF3040 domain-containing protein n=1 Tax=Kitasatospora sp. NPDC048722 TaxID=3155639 RepID=UPI0033C2DA03
MPLSEHEQRLLDQMERALYAEDPKFASALEGTGLRTYTRRRVYLAVAGFVVGVVLLMGGMVVPDQIWVSVVGFLVMLGCAVFAVTGWRRGPAGQGSGPKHCTHRPPGNPVPLPRRRTGAGGTVGGTSRSRT